MRKLKYKKDGDKWEWRWSDSDNVYWTTNGRGEGAFVIDPSHNEEHQVLGTCDFSLRGMKDASAKRKIRKWMTEDDDFWDDFWAE